MGLGVLTLHYKGVASNLPDEFENKLAYNFLLWFTFIYYMFQMIDELVEMYSTALEREKGALALLFEMNHFIGLGLAIYLPIFVLGG